MVSPFGFPGALRLKSAAEFRSLFRGASRFSIQGVAAFVKPNNLHYPRLGVVISKRNVRAAVGRNRLRRLIRESFRLHQEELKGYDIAVVAYRKAGEAANREVYVWLEQLWYKVSKQPKA